MSTPLKIVISCVIDDQPKFLMQGWNWLSSLHILGTHTRATIIVHYVEGLDPARLDPLRRLGARLVPIKPFGDGPAVYCNKIRQLDTPEVREADYAILSDADIAFLQCPARLATGTAVSAKLVDRPNPPEQAWRRIIELSGLDMPDTMEIELEPGIRTFRFNCNGGLYIIPRTMIEPIRQLWPKWARFCLSQPDVLGRHLHHSDQLGFGLALMEAQAELNYLDIYSNFPSHLKTLITRVAPAPIAAIHYHSELDNHGLISAPGIGWIDAQVSAFNAQLTDLRRDNFSNQTFWDFRYARAPELGSGVGSRGDTLLYKRALLKPYMRAFSDGAVLDVGCGDLEVMRDMPVKTYTGLDLSKEAISIAAGKRPDWSFSTRTIDSIEDGFSDLTICLDVLIHQPSREDFDRLVDHCVRSARKAVIVSGYKVAPENAGIVFAHADLELRLREHNDISSVAEIGAYRDVTVYLAVRKDALLANPHDITIYDIAFGCEQAPDWKLLLELIQVSRKHLGFFPSTIIRTIEYPWFAQRLQNLSGHRVLDIGAGICALPLWLADKGWKVVTIDNHSRVRQPPAQPNWNEWGFIDYSALSPSIESLQLSVTDYTPEDKFDSIYSVSVIEHMPASVRRQTIAGMASWLAPGGRIFLSLDLVPDTDDLWPLSEGVVVDPDTPHGTLQSILEELTGAGLTILETSVRRAIRGSRTDVAFIEAAL